MSKNAGDSERLGNVTDFSTLGQNEKELLKESQKVRELAYCPYSRFKVGAAIRSDDGTIYTGCNVENSAFGSSLCAERGAAMKAVSDGRTKFTAVAVIADLPPGDSYFTSPCGACRQFLAEFCTGRDVPVYLARSELKKVLHTSVHELLPLSFTMKDFSKIP